MPNAMNRPPQRPAKSCRDEISVSRLIFFILQRLYQYLSTSKVNLFMDPSSFPTYTVYWHTNLIHLILHVYSRWCIRSRTGSAPAVWRSRWRQRCPRRSTPAGRGSFCFSVTADKKDSERRKVIKQQRYKLVGPHEKDTREQQRRLWSFWKRASVLLRFLWTDKCYYIETIKVRQTRKERTGGRVRRRLLEEVTCLYESV